MMESLPARLIAKIPHQQVRILFLTTRVFFPPLSVLKIAVDNPPSMPSESIRRANVDELRAQIIDIPSVAGSPSGDERSRENLNSMSSSTVDRKSVVTHGTIIAGRLTRSATRKTSSNAPP